MRITRVETLPIDRYLFVQVHTDAGITGLVRCTYYPPAEAAAMRDQQLAPLTNEPDDVYRTSIQIAELNALNACLAVIRFKQLRGFYFEELPYYHVLFEVGDLKIVGDVESGEN